jgi:hypothetical protein
MAKLKKKLSQDGDQGDRYQKDDFQATVPSWYWVVPSEDVLPVAHMGILAGERG